MSDEQPPIALTDAVDAGDRLDFWPDDVRQTYVSLDCTAPDRCRSLHGTIDSTEVNGPGNAILRSVSTCDFEAVVIWAIGTTGMKNYKVALLENPTRVVIDVKW